MDCSPQGSSVLEIFQPGYWSGLPFPLPEDLPDPGIKPPSPALAGRFFTTSATWEAREVPERRVILSGRIDDHLAPYY